MLQGRETGECYGWCTSRDNSWRSQNPVGHFSATDLWGAPYFDRTQNIISQQRNNYKLRAWWLKLYIRAIQGESGFMGESHSRVISLRWQPPAGRAGIQMHSSYIRSMATRCKRKTRLRRSTALFEATDFQIARLPDADILIPRRPGILDWGCLWGTL